MRNKLCSGPLTDKAHHETEDERPEGEARVPLVVVADQHHAQEHEDDGVAGGAVGSGRPAVTHGEPHRPEGYHSSGSILSSHSSTFTQTLIGS